MVSAGNAPPVAVNDAWATNEDTPLNVSAAGVLTNDSDPESGALTAQLLTGPAHGVLTLNADGSFSYTPGSNYNGPDSFTYRARDPFNANSSAATVSLTVNPVNDAPVAVADAYGTNVGTTLNVVRVRRACSPTTPTLRATALTAQIVSLPASRLSDAQSERLVFLRAARRVFRACARSLTGHRTAAHSRTR